ncbi:MAG: preprotein translocase subunit YajC [Planctomycetes bacterium]|nr:preprotein translocase subunit YajC [Planctomycetota bacterium]MCA8934599.1 preprotein translocase subunit YajC [Planctomycetota bacterium]MCA8946296.1 preprotein translocase subunit YajC [Planctomycetota bacterium]
MNTLLTFLAQGQPDANPIAGFAPMILIILIFVVFMFFMRRSQKRQEQTHKNMVEELEKGARVMLNSGLIARVEKIDKEAQEAKLLVDEEKKVHSVYSLLAIAKVFEEKKSNQKKED